MFQRNNPLTVPTPLDAPYRVFISTHEPAVQRGLQLLISPELDLMICGIATTDALDGLHAAEPDLVIVELTFRYPEELKILQRIRKQCPAVRILVVSLADDWSCTRAAFAGGAHAYLTREVAAEHIIETIRELRQTGRATLALANQKTPNLPPP